jgi:hypothetical protein
MPLSYLCDIIAAAGKGRTLTKDNGNPSRAAHPKCSTPNNQELKMGLLRALIGRKSVAILMAKFIMLVSLVKV